MRRFRTTVQRDAVTDPETGVTVADLCEVVTDVAEFTPPSRPPAFCAQVLPRIHAARVRLAKLPRPRRERVELLLARSAACDPEELPTRIESAIGETVGS